LENIVRLKIKTSFMKPKQVFILVFLFTYQIPFAQYTDIINSNRPSESMGAFSVGKKVIQLESGFSYLKEKHSILDYNTKGVFMDLTARYGFWKEQLEFISEISYQNDKFIIDDETQKRSGLRNTTFGLKYLFYDPFKNAKEKKVNVYSWKANHQNKFNWRQLVPALSGYAAMSLNFKNVYNSEPNNISIISPKVMLITQNIIGNGYVVIGNVFMDKISTPRSSLGYIITLTRAVNERWSVFLENKGIKGDFYADGIFSGGAAYLLSNDMQLDASISSSYKDTPSIVYAGIGISWRSDVNYEDFMLRLKKEDDGGKKGKSKKDKKKKRLDEVEVEKPK